MHKLTTEELAYLAGIFDGEGCVQLNLWKNSVRVKAEITNTSRTLIDWILATTKVGAVSTRKASGNRRICYRWCVSCNQAIELLIQIRPWLLIKSAQVDLILEWHKLEMLAGARIGKYVSKERISSRTDLNNQLKLLKRVS